MLLYKHTRKHTHLLYKSPQQRYALQRLPESHLVGHDTAERISDSVSGHAVVQELHSFTLMRTQHLVEVERRETCEL